MEIADKLNLTVLSSVATGIGIRGLLLRDDGEVVPFQETINSVPATRAGKTVRVSLAKGFLLSFTTTAPGASVLQRGQCYATIDLERNGLARARLCDGYLTDNHKLGWPPKTTEHPTDGRGAVYNPAPASPAAGAEISITVPSNAVWNLESLDFTLVADSTVATRGPKLIIDDGTNIFFSFSAAELATVTASGTQEYSIGKQGVSNGSAANALIEFYPWLRLGPGFRIRTVTSSLAAGDQYTINAMDVEELLAI